MKKNRRRVDRQVMTAAQENLDAGVATQNAQMQEYARQQRARRLVGCNGCNANFFRDLCKKNIIPAHYRVYEGGKVSLCPGSDRRFRRPHVNGVFFQ